MSASNDSPIRVFAFAAGVCLVCSLVVSAAAVSLRATQEKNALNEKRSSILVAAGLANPGEKLSSKTIDEQYQKITPVIVDLKTGDLVKDKNPNTYNMYEAATKKDEGHELQIDPANIKHIANDGSAYLLIKDHKIDRIILPIQGYGLWSTMYGFTSLVPSKDNNGLGNVKINGITFYQQGETPGLGARVTDPTWQANWTNVRAFNKEGLPQVQVTKLHGNADDGKVDAIAGATLTSRGVQHLMNFWLGEQGYLPFIKKIESGKITADIAKSYSNND